MIFLSLVNLIMFCISSMNITVVWNDDTLPVFKPERRLGQGDPLSPYLFIMIMKQLSHLILEKLERRL